LQKPEPIFHVLRHTSFRAIWFSALISNLGGLIQAVGAAWLMTSLAEADSMVALVQTSSTLPIMLFSIPAGALADSFDRRRIMLIAQTAMLLISLGLAILAWFNLLTPWLLLGCTFLIGCGLALFNPSWQSSIGDIVPKQDIASAVTLNGMGFNMMRSVGPAIGGVIVTIAGAAGAFAANTVSYLALILALSRWKPPSEPRLLPREAFGPAIFAGLRYFTMSSNLVHVMLRGFLFGAGAIVVLALLPIVARELLNGTAVTYGLLLGMFGVGGILGGVLGARLKQRMRNEVIVRSAFGMLALAVIGLSLSRDLWLSCVLLVPSGAGWVLAMSLFNVTVQLSTPRWVVGRVLAIFQTLTFGGMAIGAWFWGAMADLYSAPTALILASGLLLLGLLVGTRLPVGDSGGLDLDPLNRFVEPAVRLDLKSRNGPIMVMVDYDIHQGDIDAFLSAMIDRRRMRIRDGARQWLLLRDLEDPDIWTESYHVPTWVEYVRHHQRRVKSDAGVTERLLALHKGEKPPRVRRMIERPTVPRHDDMPVKLPLDIH